MQTNSQKNLPKVIPADQADAFFNEPSTTKTVQPKTAPKVISAADADAFFGTSSVEEQRKERTNQGLPVAVNKNKVAPTKAGQFVRDVVKGSGVIDVAANISDIKREGSNLVESIGGVLGLSKKTPQQMAQDQQAGRTAPITSDYFGSTDARTNIFDDPTKAMKQNAGTALKIASNLPIAKSANIGFQGLKTLLKGGVGNTVKTVAKKSLLPLAVEGGVGGGFQMGGEALSQDKSMKDVAIDTAKGVATGAIAAPLLGGVAIPLAGATARGSLNTASTILGKPTRDAVEKAQASVTNKLEKFFTRNKTAKNRFLDAPEGAAKMFTDRGKEYIPRVSIGGNLEADSAIQNFERSIFDKSDKISQAAAKSGLTVPIDDFEKAVVGNINSNAQLRRSGLTEGTVQKARAKLASYRASYPNGIPLEEINQIRKEINVKYDPDNFDVNRAIGDATRDTLDALIPDAEVRAVNREIGEEIELRDLLSKNNGLPVQGGKLTQGLGRILGAILTKDSNIPGTSVLGAAGGDAVTRMMQSFSITNPLERKALGSVSKQQSPAMKALEEYLARQPQESNLLGPGATRMGGQSSPTMQTFNNYDEFLASMGLSRQKDTPLQLPAPTSNATGPTIPLPARSQSTLDAQEQAIIQALRQRQGTLPGEIPQNTLPNFPDALEPYTPESAMPVIEMGAKRSNQTFPNNTPLVDVNTPPKVAGMDKAEQVRKRIINELTARLKGTENIDGLPNQVTEQKNIIPKKKLPEAKAGVIDYDKNIADRMRIEAKLPPKTGINISDKSKIAPDLAEPIKVSIKDLEPMEHDTFAEVKTNLKNGSKTVQEYKNKIIKNEPISPAIVLKHIDSTGTWYEVQDGHHKIQAAIELGVKDFPVQIVRTINKKSLK